jgi:hypothetical protein
MLSSGVTVSPAPFLVSCFFPPTAMLIAVWTPAEGRHDRDNSPLIHGADAVGFEPERVDRDAGDCRRFDAHQVGGDRLLPGIAFVARRLSRHDLLLFELVIRPPVGATAIVDNRLGEQLIAIAR